MTLTHDEIAAMTAVQVNKEIAIRRGYPSTVHVAYCGDWELAGRLLEEMAGKASGLPDLGFMGDHWVCYALINVEPEPAVAGHTAPTATEAIARCWLEWWEVTHDTN